MRAQRDRQPKVSHPGRAAKVALVLCLIAGGVWLATLSPFVAVKNVVVQTPNQATADYIRSYVNLPPHISTLTYPLSWVAAAAMRCPVVRSAVAERHLLRHKIVIIPVLRTPMCAVSADNGYLAIDEEGVVFRGLATLPAGLPVVEGFHPAPTQVGQWVHPWYAQLLGPCIRSARESGLKGDLSVDVGNRHLVTLTTADGVLCKLGGPEDLPLKVSLCSDILRSITASGYKAEYVDVRVPERPVWKPKGAAPPAEQPAPTKAVKAPTHAPATKAQQSKKAQKASDKGAKAETDSPSAP